MILNFLGRMSVKIEKGQDFLDLDPDLDLIEVEEWEDIRKYFRLKNSIEGLGLQEEDTEIEGAGLETREGKEEIANKTIWKKEDVSCVVREVTSKGIAPN